MANAKYCVVGYYFSPETILEASRKVRDRGFERFDTFTPFPVHGMDEAMGIKRSWLPYVSFAAGAVGCIGGVGLTVWTHAFSWPMNIAGKPLFSLPAYVPVVFEMTVLFAGVVTAVFMFTMLLGLPNFRKPVFHPDITCDRFAMAIEVDSLEEVESVKDFLKQIQAQEIHYVEGVL